jgi:hypothetical protein
MATVSLEARVAALEVEVTRLKQELQDQKDQHSWKQVIGTFANDPIYEEAMKLGRQYRESLRPKPKGIKKRKKQA